MIRAIGQGQLPADPDTINSPAGVRGILVQCWNAIPEHRPSIIWCMHNLSTIDSDTLLGSGYDDDVGIPTISLSNSEILLTDVLATFTSLEAYPTHYSSHAKALQQLGWLYMQPDSGLINYDMAVRYLKESLEAGALSLLPTFESSWSHHHHSAFDDLQRVQTHRPGTSSAVHICQPRTT